MKTTVEFGRYLMKEGVLREIEWIVLNETPNGKKLLISKDCIEAMQYEYTENKNDETKTMAAAWHGNTGDGRGGTACSRRGAGCGTARERLLHAEV